MSNAIDNNDVGTAYERYDTPAADYHADTESISNSMLQAFIESPELYYGRYVSKQFPAEQSDAMDLGTVVHDAVLCGGGLSNLCLEIPANALDSNGHKRGKKWETYEYDHPGAILLKPKEFASVRLMYDGVMANERAKAIIEAEGPVESNWKWTCSLTGMKRRARLDKFAERLLVIGDLKTTTDISPRQFLNSVVTFRYFVQQVYYQDAIHAETGELPQFVFIAVEKKPPFRCRCYDLDDVFVQRGEQIKNEALVALDKCRVSGCWTAPESSLIVTLGAPYWLSAPNDQWALPTE